MIRLGASVSEEMENVITQNESFGTGDSECNVADANKTPENKSLNIVSFVRKLFYLYGVDISEQLPINIVRKCNCTYFSFRILFWNLIFFTFIYSSFFFNYERSNEAFAKMILGIKMREILSILLWYGLFWKRHQLFELLSLFIKTSEKRQVTFRKRYFLVSSVYISVVFACGLATFAYSWNGRNCILIYHVMLGLTNIKNCSLMYALEFAYYLIINILHICISVVYMLLCIFGQKFLQRHLNDMQIINERKGVPDPVTRRILYNQYDDTILILKIFEDSMSFLAFLLQIQNLCSIFILFISFGWSEYTIEYETKANYRLYFTGIYSILSFLLISIFAIRLNETDKTIKEIQTQLFRKSKNAVILNQTQDTENPPCCISHPFVLTGWGFFNFNKSFILSSMGNILTYILLFTQIQLTPTTALGKN